VFVVDGQQIAKKSTYGVQGERGGSLFLDPGLPAGSRVVTEGRALLKDGDRVDARLEAPSKADATTVKIAGVKP
jgi:hypothetical protein